MQEIHGRRHGTGGDKHLEGPMSMVKTMEIDVRCSNEAAREKKNEVFAAPLQVL
jgi:hypothetical protein